MQAALRLVLGMARIRVRPLWGLGGRGVPITLKVSLPGRTSLPGNWTPTTAYREVGGQELFLHLWVLRQHFPHLTVHSPLRVWNRAFFWCVRLKEQQEDDGLHQGH